MEDETKWFESFASSRPYPQITEVLVSGRVDDEVQPSHSARGLCQRQCDVTDNVTVPTPSVGRSWSGPRNIMGVVKEQREKDYTGSA